MKFIIFQGVTSTISITKQIGERSTSSFQRLISIFARFIACPIWRGLPILRDPGNKWYASFEDIPLEGKVGEQCYPTDCSGWLWITTPGTAKAIAEAAQEVKFFWIDDVWVTGYIAEHLGIEHQELIHLWTMRAEQLLLYKAIQNPQHYCPDYISGLF